MLVHVPIPMTLKEKFFDHDPKAFFLDGNDLRALQHYLKQNGWLTLMEELVSAEIAGPGNMNYTIRVSTADRSFIVKQSRPWVEKFRFIDAPPERAIVEGQFYQLVQLDKELKKYTPQILGFDEISSIIILEDLGHASDYNHIYKKGEELSGQDLNTLVNILSTLHTRYNVHTTRERIYNRRMRKLNHEHLFLYPFDKDNGFNLDEAVMPGLQTVANGYKADEALKLKIKELGEVYLADGDTLLHGDFYPGSWLSTDNGSKIIDPEFCFFGPREFELAVLIAHLKMAQQPQGHYQFIKDNYKGFDELNIPLLLNFVGVELMRRIIGLAQLPLDLTLAERVELLEHAYDMIMVPDSVELFNAIRH